MSDESRMERKPMTTMSKIDLLNLKLEVLKERLKAGAISETRYGLELSHVMNQIDEILREG